MAPVVQTSSMSSASSGTSTRPRPRAGPRAAPSAAGRPAAGRRRAAGTRQGQRGRLGDCDRDLLGRVEPSPTPTPAACGHRDHHPGGLVVRQRTQHGGGRDLGEGQPARVLQSVDDRRATPSNGEAATARSTPGGPGSITRGAAARSASHRSQSTISSGRAQPHAAQSGGAISEMTCSIGHDPSHKRPPGSSREARSLPRSRVGRDTGGYDRGESAMGRSSPGATGLAGLKPSSPAGGPPRRRRGHRRLFPRPAPRRGGARRRSRSSADPDPASVPDDDRAVEVHTQVDLAALPDQN